MMTVIYVTLRYRYVLCFALMVDGSERADRKEGRQTVQAGKQACRQTSNFVDDNDIYLCMLCLFVCTVCMYLLVWYPSSMLCINIDIDYRLSIDSSGSDGEW